MTLPATTAFLLLSACAGSSPDARPQKEAPPTTPIELQQRLIDYAHSLKQASDGAQDRFTSMLGVTLVPISPGVSGGKATNLPLSGGYVFYADYSSLHPSGSFPMHEVGLFQPGKKELTEDPQADCFWQAAQAARALESIGYQHGGEGPFQRGRLQDYGRAIGDGTQAFAVSLLTYTTEKPVPQTCVYAVRFTGGDR